MKQHSLHNQAKGQVLLTFVFFVIVLIIFIGLVIDLGFAYVTRSSLSKAVDAASLAGVRNLFQGDDRARAIANASFRANYGRPGRDAADVIPSINIFTDASRSRVMDVDATASINTYFVRVLPGWKTVSVSAHAQATRQRIVLGLVLDRSGSMGGNGGGAALPGAVSNFIDNFIENHDRASMSSFSQFARLDVAMTNTFKSPIKTAASGLSFAGWTASEQGLTNGWAQVRKVTPEPGEEMLKVVVFFTDGLANTWQYNFVCGALTNTLNISPERNLWDPVTGGLVLGCTIPATIPSITNAPPPHVVDTVGQCPNADPSDPTAYDIYLEGQKRAENIARQIRAEGTYVYAIGLGNPNGPKECDFPPLNVPFLERIANTTNSTTYTLSQPEGAVAIASTAGDLDRAFNEIASKILIRLTR